MKSYLEQAFGRGDVTSARMQAAIREWLNLYYGTQSPGEDAADRLAVLVVSKLCRDVVAEYESRRWMPCGCSPCSTHWLAVNAC